MTNFEKIKSMTIDELTQFFLTFDMQAISDGLFCGGGICPHKVGKYECGLGDGNCIYVKNNDDFTPIKMWLESEANFG